MIIAGETMKCGGIGSVAVLPEFRMNGIARQLMMAAFASMRTTDTPLSLLYPFKHSFYQRMGYGLIGDIHTMTVPTSSIPRFSERDDVQTNPVVAIDTDGDFTIVWQSRGQDDAKKETYGIYAQRFSPSGLTIGGTNEVQVLKFNNGPVGTFVLKKALRRASSCAGRR